MLPARTPQTLRVVQAFDLIAPDGQIHRFPKVTRLQRAAVWLHSLAEPAILMAVVLGLNYTAGVWAESMESSIRSLQDLFPALGPAVRRPRAGATAMLSCCFHDFLRPSERGGAVVYGLLLAHCVISLLRRKRPALGARIDETLPHISA